MPIIKLDLSYRPSCYCYDLKMSEKEKIEQLLYYAVHTLPIIYPHYEEGIGEVVSVKLINGSFTLDFEYYFDDDVMYLEVCNPSHTYIDISIYDNGIMYPEDKYFIANGLNSDLTDQLFKCAYDKNPNYWAVRSPHSLDR